MKQEKSGPNFLKGIIEKDVATKKHGGQVVTRFPPEPNGHLHIGHAKSICLNFGLADEFEGRCHLRFDDTNPETEEVEYIQAIQRDIKWLGFDWGSHLYFASDYFDQLYQWAELLIKEGKAYVCSLSEAQVKEYRGDFNRPGVDSPFRTRSVGENLDLFSRMKRGEFQEGEHTLRAKIDMKSPNMNMRDPLLYRIKLADHPKAGSQWKIFPMYDYAHPLSDAIEGITHSICTLEFQDHRPFYDWCIENLPVPARPRQYEFARLNMTYLVMSKRKLLQLVKEGHVSGWDDPRMPTLAGFRRRGVRPEAIRNFATRIGVAKAHSLIDYEILEECIRDDLDICSQRAMAVINPIKVVIENWPQGKKLELSPGRHPKKPEWGQRQIHFTKEIYIEASDFSELDDPNFFRLKPGGEVRLRNAYVIKCKEVIKDSHGEIQELRCEYDEVTLGGKPPADGHKVKGIIHWVSATECLSAEVRMYGRLFQVSDPEVVPEGKDFKANLNQDSLVVHREAKIEKSLDLSDFKIRYQFERVGYFCQDSETSRPDSLVFNMVVDLKDRQAARPRD